MDNRFCNGFYGPHPQLAVPESFDLCLTYEEQVMYLNDKVIKLEARIAELDEKIQNNFSKTY